MTYRYFRQTDAQSLIVVFLGWGFPAGEMPALSKPGYSVLLLSGYDGFSPLELEREICRDGRPQEVVVVGWSFGVRIATEFLRQTTLNVTLRLAVNGTPTHIGDADGIPQAIFNGTLAGLDPANYGRFRRRCGEPTGPEISAGEFASLRRELEMFGELPPFPCKEWEGLWDKAVIGGRDMIFPPANQRMAWGGVADIHEYPDMRHLPDFQRLIDEFVIDKNKVADKFSTASGSYAAHAVSQREVAREVAGLLAEAAAAPAGRIVELGCGDGTFTVLYCNGLDAQSRLVLCDIRPESNLPAELAASGCRATVEYRGMDVESEIFINNVLPPESAYAIVSSSMLQWLNSPQQMLVRCAAALKPGGVMALSLYVAGTLQEVASVTGRGLKYPTVDALRRVFARSGLMVKEERLKENRLEFDSPLEALRHLKLTGVNALGGEASAAQVRRLLDNWPRNDAGRATLTFTSAIFLLEKNG